MIKVFIGHFTWLPYNPYVFAGDLTPVCESGSKFSGKWMVRGGYWRGLGLGRAQIRRCWVVQEVVVGLRRPLRPGEEVTGIPAWPVRDVLTSMVLT